jgi:hypothetical protein
MQSRRAEQEKNKLKLTEAKEILEKIFLNPSPGIPQHFRDSAHVLHKKIQEFEVTNTPKYQSVTGSEWEAVFRAMVPDIGRGRGIGGHWYRCPNGHPYTIGECGGAMQVSQCPECGEAVGGTSHRLLQNNSELDIEAEISGPDF